MGFKVRRFEFVALDLETSGLDARQDSIIEVGLARMAYEYEVDCKHDGQVVVIDEWQSLVKPLQSISFLIESITGITNEMLEDAPDWEEVVSMVVDFVGDDALVGHSVHFDLNFLQQYGLNWKKRVTYDTYFLGTMLVRQAPSHNLGRLSAYLNIEFDDHHRALADAKASGFLLGHLITILSRSGNQCSEKLRFFLEGRDYEYGELFLTFLPERQVSVSDNLVKAFEKGKETDLEDEQFVKNNGKQEVKWSQEQVVSFFDDDGPLAGVVPGFKPRRQQLEMAKVVDEAFLEERLALIEAETGVGKSLGYLVPASFCALSQSVSVVVATDTHHLQDQLCEKELPRLQKAWASLGVDFRFALLKGRDQYLCLRRLYRLMRKTGLTQMEMHFIVKILLWLPNTTTGQRQEVAFRKDEYRLWNLVSSSNIFGGRALCSTVDEESYYDRAWRLAKKAHVVVTNQSFLGLSRELQSDSFPYLVIDEAHHLEDTLTKQHTKEMSDVFLKEWLSFFGKKIQGQWTGLMQEIGNLNGDNKLIGDWLDRLWLEIGGLYQFRKKFFSSLLTIMLPEDQSKRGEIEKNFLRQVRVTSKERQLEIWSDVVESSELMVESFNVVVSILQQVINRLQDNMRNLKFDKRNNVDDLLDILRAKLEECHLFLHVLRHGVLDSQPEREVVYLRYEPRFSAVTLCVAPLQVGDIVDDFLWKSKKSLVLTSATLSVGKSFDYVKSQLSLGEDIMLSKQTSPFDYEKNVQLYLPDNFPAPGSKSFDIKVADEIFKFASHFEGRTLVLFTAYSYLKNVHNLLHKRFDKVGLELLSQGVVGSRKRIIMRFFEESRSVILGTSSFWEGVDFPGDMLKCVVIVKLPFDVPSNPEFAARSELYDNPFLEYSLPRALLRFRQGCGRLIRTSEDSGVIVILDNRVLNKFYGKQFVDLFPQGIRRFEWPIK